MLELTQSLDPPNCWQTCVACLLDVPAEALPPQGRGRYWNELNAYLEKHHGLAYVEIGAPVIEVVGPPELHMLIGPTVRTASNGFDHVVVARRGVMVWDPHPSRAGLTVPEKWGLLAPMPSAWKESRDRKRAEGGQSAADVTCVCPECRR